MTFHLSDKAIEQLEFDKILDLVCSYCRGVPASESYRSKINTIPFENLASILQEVNDFLQLRMVGSDIHFGEYESIDQDLDMLVKEGYVSDAESILRILRILHNYQQFYEFFSKENKREYPRLYELGKIEEYSSDPIKVIVQVFDEKGEIKPSASPELAKIYKKTEQASREVDRVFNEIVAKHKADHVLSDNAESWKNGRRVLVMPAENKRKISGVIHDQSASGKTIFMEPQEIIQINNHLFSLESEKRAEIYKILRGVSDKLRTHFWLIKSIYNKVIEIDLVRAKAILARKTSSSLPELTPRPALHLKDVKHPLLLLQEAHQGPKTVAFDLELKGKNRILLISGPNAGGKSVTLKAVGLVHAMIYNGLLVPLSPDSVIGKFLSIETDIGDHQSINEGLSTYSSHLSNLNNIVSGSNKSRLILLDEIGSGTDPKLGGAIAEGIIKSLLTSGAYGIITTHYSALKVFAFRNKGILNGAMLFDKENLRPSYKLKVGKPGSSYAFEVAKKIGLDDNIIKYARKKVGSKENAIEDLLVNLQQGKASLDEKLEKVTDEKARLEKLIKNYEDLSKEYQVKRKRLQIRAKEIEVQRANQESHQLQSLINKLQKEKNLDEALARKEKAKEKRSQEVKEIIALKTEVSERGSETAEIVEGSFVRMVDSDMNGEVLSIKKNKAQVLFGLLKMDVDLADLVISRDQLEINKNTRINVKGVAFDSNFSPKLDIRGYKMDDADRTLEEFFDRALMNNMSTLEVVHGKGSGALRKLVKKKIKEYPDITHSWHPADEMGGEGVTLIKL